MNIDTRTIVSNSNNFQKRVKDSQSTDKSEKVLDSNKITSADNRVLTDFSDVSKTDSSYKRRVVENNVRLTEYEDNYNRLEFIQQQIEMIEDLDLSKDRAEIASIVENSVYAGVNVFDKYTENRADVAEKISEIKRAVSVETMAMQEEFKSIEITNQNMLSLNKVSDNDVAKIADLSKSELSKAFNLNNKRVMDLIS